MFMVLTSIIISFFSYDPRPLFVSNREIKITFNFRQKILIYNILNILINYFDTWVLKFNV